MGNKLIEIENLSKVYPFGTTKIKALNSVDLAIAAGEFVSIMGPSGSGKSTLLNLLGVLDTPSSGSYHLDGTEVSDKIDLTKIRREKIGFIFQTFNLLHQLSATKNVELPMIYKGIPSKEREKRAVDLLKKVGLGNRLNHKPNELSGGQRQRVAIARALANEPRIILADEPTGNLDSKSGEEVMYILKDLNKNNNTTLILVTHEDYLAKEAARIIKLKDGKIKSDKKTK